MKRFSLAALMLSSLATTGCFLQQPVSGGSAGIAGRIGSDGDARDGGAGGNTGAGGTAMNCSALPFGCVCSPTEPTQVGACTTSSVVKMPGQQGVCCDNAFNCICVAYECVRMGGGCSCQLAQASVSGTRVENCSAVTSSPTINCCRSYGQCVCSSMECLPTETQVSACSVQDLLTCGVGERSVGTCEGAGTGGVGGSGVGPGGAGGGDAGAGGGNAGAGGTAGAGGSNAGAGGVAGTGGSNAGAGGAAAGRGGAAGGSAGRGGNGGGSAGVGGAAGGGAGRGGTTGGAAGTGGGNAGAGGTAAGSAGRGGNGGGSAGRGDNGGRGGFGSGARGGNAGGRAGAGGTGGAASEALAAAGVLDGQAWVLRCGGTAGARRCTSANVITNNYPSTDPLGGRVSRNDFGTFGGAAGAPYCVTVRVQGLTASKSYADDAITGRSGAPYGIPSPASFGASFDANGDGANGWVAGGIPGAADNHSVNALLVGSPLQIYYLNSIATQGDARSNDTSYVVDYTATFPVNGGASLQFIAADFDGTIVGNCAPGSGSGCSPNSLTGLPAVREPPGTTIEDPFNGQFLIMTVVAARAGTCTCPTPATCS